jgi:aminoglycoside 6'-N-acetyltransferase I
LGNRYGLQIRAAIVADARGIAELFGAAGIAMDARALEARIDAIRSGPGTLLLAEEWGASLETDRPVARIGTLLVAPDDRRRGIGRTLLKAGAQAARAAGCGDLVLDVGDGADGLDAFARATGFEPSGRVLQRSLRKRA